MLGRILDFFRPEKRFTPLDEYELFKASLPSQKELDRRFIAEAELSAMKAFGEFLRYQTTDTCQRICQLFKWDCCAPILFFDSPAIRYVNHWEEVPELDFHEIALKSTMNY